MTRKNKIVISTIAIIIAVVISSFLYAFYSYEKYVHVSASDVNNKNNLSKEELDAIEKDKNNVKYREVDGITNILLLGTDGRTLDEASRSDTIMILTIDDKHKKLKLTSIMRDTFVEIPGHGEQKINAAFAFGGTTSLMKTIEKNFQIKLDKYAIINFFGFKDLIDSIGGLDIEVKPSELHELNRVIVLEAFENPDLAKHDKALVKELIDYPDRINPNLEVEDVDFVKEAGLQHLNGQQALAYSRMRHVGNGSYERTERQRHVVNLIVDKLKDVSPVKYPSIIPSLMSCVKTNVDFGEATNLAYTAYKIGNFNMDQLQVPATKLSDGRIYKNKGWVLLIDKELNIKMLHDFVFEDKNYSEKEYPTFKYAESEYYYVPEPKDTTEEQNNDGTVEEENNQDTDNTEDQVNNEGKENNNTEDSKDTNESKEDQNNTDNKNTDSNSGQNNSENNKDTDSTDGAEGNVDNNNSGDGTSNNDETNTNSDQNKDKDTNVNTGTNTTDKGNESNNNNSNTVDNNSSDTESESLDNLLNDLVNDSTNNTQKNTQNNNQN